MKRLAIFLTLLISLTLHAQSPVTASGLASFVPPPSGGGGGGAWTVVAHTFGNGSTGNTTSSPIDTTGANFLIAFVESAGFNTFSDSKGNTWTQGNDPSGSPRGSFMYCFPTTGVGSGHTFSITGGAGGQSFIIVAFTKGAGTASLDNQTAGANGNYYSGQSLVPGSITPATSADLMLSAVIFDTQASTAGSTINSSYVVADSGHSTAGKNLLFAYKIKTDATAENPTWAATWAFGPGGAAVHAAYK